MSDDWGLVQGADLQRIYKPICNAPSRPLPPTLVFMVQAYVVFIYVLLGISTRLLTVRRSVCFSCICIAFGMQQILALHWNIETVASILRDWVLSAKLSLIDTRYYEPTISYKFIMLCSQNTQLLLNFRILSSRFTIKVVFIHNTVKILNCQMPNANRVHRANRKDV